MRLAERARSRVGIPPPGGAHRVSNFYFSTYVSHVVLLVIIAEATRPATDAADARSYPHWLWNEVPTEFRWPILSFFTARCCFNADYAVARCLSVCPSVRPFVTRRYSVETAKHIIRLFSPSGSHTILVFPQQKAWKYSDGDPSSGGV